MRSVTPGLLLLAFCFGLCAAPQPPGAFWPETEADAAEAEARIKRNPNDLKAREGMVRWCTKHRQRERGLEHAWWVLERAPDSSSAAGATMLILVRPAKAEDEQKVEAIWKRHLEQQGESIQVLTNAAQFYERTNLDKAEALYKRAAAKEQPGPIALARMKLSWFYGMAIVSEAMGASVERPELIGFNQRVRAELMQSSDFDMVGRTGQFLAGFGQNTQPGMPGAIKEVAAFGEKLLERARQGQPDNPEWNKPAVPPRPAAPPAAARIRVAEEVQRKSLTMRYVPQYPPGASGNATVRFSILIGTDGRVLEVSPLSGPAAFIEAAEKAVRMYEYEPPRDNGQPVEVQTEVEVRFIQPG